MYDLIYGIATVLYIVVLTFYGQAYGFSKLKSFVLGTIAVVVDYFVILFVTWVESGFQNFGNQNAVRVFVFNPFLIYVVAKLMKVDVRKFSDFNAFPAMVWYGLGHFACLAANCCRGYAYYEGTFMYKVAYALTGTNMLPQPTIESIGALAIAAVLLAIGIKYKFQTKGYMYYIMLILYGSQRFFVEFFRNNQKVIVFREMTSAKGNFGISSLALWALAMFIEGVIILTLLVRWDKKQEAAKIASAAA